MGFFDDMCSFCSDVADLGTEIVVDTVDFGCESVRNVGEYISEGICDDIKSDIQKSEIIDKGFDIADIIFICYFRINIFTSMSVNCSKR